MSDSQTSKKLAGGPQIALASGLKRSKSLIKEPHFRCVPTTSTHEQAVINAGYPWVRTNPLIPTWMSPDADPRPGVSVVPDRLNQHSHHGINTHLIVEGDLTLRRIKNYFGVDAVGASTLSMDPGAPKEFSAAPHEMYWATSQQGCKFVEGHRCLSPASAHRYMSRGSLEWVGRTGQPAAAAHREFVLEQLRNAVFKTEFDYKAMQRVATSCTFPEDNTLTRSLQQWFLREWNDPAVQLAKGDLCPVDHPAGPFPDVKIKAAGFDGDDDSSGDEEDGAASLVHALEGWMNRGIPEN